jgi:hypothetical protein
MYERLGSPRCPLTLDVLVLSVRCQATPIGQPRKCGLTR